VFIPDGKTAYVLNDNHPAAADASSPAGVGVGAGAGPVQPTASGAAHPAATASVNGRKNNR
jgi:hypothetical protein